LSLSFFGTECKFEFQSLHHNTNMCLPGALQKAQVSTYANTLASLSSHRHSLIFSIINCQFPKAYGSMDSRPEFITNFDGVCTAPAKCLRSRPLTPARSCQPAEDRDRGHPSRGTELNWWALSADSPVHQTDMDFWRWNQPQTVNLMKIEAGIDVRTTILLRNIPNRVDSEDRRT
jgi:hypothetical protein